MPFTNDDSDDICNDNNSCSCAYAPIHEGNHRSVRRLTCKCFGPRHQTEVCGTGSLSAFFAHRERVHRPTVDAMRTFCSCRNTNPAVQLIIIIQFNSLLLLCCINSQKANYRCSTRDNNNNNNNNNLSITRPTAALKFGDCFNPL
jgi:hypothetical protein